MDEYMGPGPNSLSLPNFVFGLVSKADGSGALLKAPAASTCIWAACTSFLTSLLILAQRPVMTGCWLHAATHLLHVKRCKGDGGDPFAVPAQHAPRNCALAPFAH